MPLLVEANVERQRGWLEHSGCPMLRDGVFWICGLWFPAKGTGLLLTGASARVALGFCLSARSRAQKVACATDFCVHVRSNNEV